MAKTIVDVLNVKKPNVASEGTPQTAAVADGFEIPITGKSITLVVKATGAGTLTFKQGNGIQGVKDLIVSVAAGKTIAIKVDTGHFENVSGEDKGKILAIPSVATLELLAIED